MKNLSSNKIRCLYVSYNGAMEPLLQSQCIPYLRELKKKGIDFTLLSFEKKNGSWQKTLNSASQLKKKLAQYGIKWYWLLYHKRPSLPATLFDMFCGLILACWLIITKKINVVHTRAAISAAMVFILIKIFKLKFIFDMRGINADEYVDAGLWTRTGLIYRFFRFMEKKILLSADSIVVLTKRAFQIISQEGFVPNGNNLDIRVIPCCVDLATFNYSGQVKGTTINSITPREEPFIFVYSGSVGTWYMLDEMLDFFMISKEYIPNARFLILARSDKDIIEKAIKQKGLNKSDVSIITAVYSDMPDYLHKANAAIFFIKACFSKQASCPIKMGEYLACGLPMVVNTGIGDIDEIVRSKNIGIIVEGFKNDCYRNAVQGLLELMKEGAVLRRRCRETARDYFSLEQGVERYWQIYQGLSLK